MLMRLNMNENLVSLEKKKINCPFSDSECIETGQFSTQRF